MRRVFVVSMILLCIAAIVGSLNYWGIIELGFDPTAQKLSPYQAVPNNAAIILTFKNIRKTRAQLRTTDYWPELAETDLVGRLDKNLQLLERLLSLEASTSVTVSVHLASAKQYDFLYLIEDSKMDFEQMETLLSKASSFTTSKRVYEKVNIFDLFWDDERYTVAYLDGLILGSRSPFLVEDAVLKAKTKQKFKQEELFRFVKKMSNSEVGISINLENIGSLAPVFIKKAELAQSLGDFSAWLELELHIRQGALSFSGYAVPDSNHRVLSRQGAGNLDLLQVVPEHAAVLVYTGISDLASYYSNTIHPNTKVSYILPWIGNEYAYLITEALQEQYSDNCFAIIHARDSELAKNSLAELLALTPDSLQQKKVYRDLHFSKLELGSSLAKIFGNMFDSIQNPWSVILNEYVIFGNSEKKLEQLVDKIIEQKTLAKDQKYQRFAEQLTSQANRYIYIDPSKCFFILKGLLSDTQLLGLQDDFARYRKFGPIAFQFSSFKDIFLVNGVLPFDTIKERGSSLLWELSLDTSARSGPQVIYNHRSKTSETLVQDLADQLYLISKGGSIQWKILLDGAIIGRIKQIDYYKNGKFQFLFNTAERIHLIDINGRPVAHFPIRLAARATNSVFVVDYDNNRKYRYFVACENEHIYGFERGGKPLANWNPKRDMGKILFPIMHFNENGKDNIVAVNTAGQVHFFNRRGEARMKAIELHTQLVSPFSLDRTQSPYQLVSSDTAGSIVKVSSSGNIEKLFIATGSGRHQFIYADLTSDSVPEFILLDGQFLEVIGTDSSLVFDHTFEAGITEPMQIVRLKGKILLGISDIRSQQAFLFNGDGKIVAAYNGNSSFEIAEYAGDGRVILLIAGGERSIRAYLLE